MEEQKKVFLTAGIIVSILALALISYFLFLRPAKEASVPSQSPALQEETLPAEEETVAPVMAEVEPLDVDLANSDEVVRERALGLSANALFVKWIETEGIIPKFTAAVDSVANGMSPRPQIEFFKPRKEFEILWEDDNAYISEASYARYDPVATVLSSLDAAACVQLYLQMKPAVQEAYAQLGYPEADFTKTLERAFIELLRVPVPQGKIAVERTVQTYVYRDPELEGLSEAQKHLLRMGPKNVALIQDKIREIGGALGLTLNP
jgi:hypothetical protein